MNFSKLTARTRMVGIEEGFSAELYICPADKLSVGFGLNVEAHKQVTKAGLIRWCKKGISKREAVGLLDTYLVAAEKYAKKYKWFADLHPARQAVVVSMIYQMGPAGFSGFKNLQLSLTKGNFKEAARHMLDSKWARKDSPERAARHAHQMRQGRWHGYYKGRVPAGW